MITQNEISSLNMSPTKKDFVQIWNELIEIASKITERWDPTSTNESDPGIVLLKVLAGIADKLNYNIDKNILEAYMPTAAQTESMQKLCELVGYDIKYYQSAATKVRISYTGEDEINVTGFGLPVPKFTTVTNADKDIAFVTTNPLTVYISNDVPWVEVPCIEGQISQCESVNDNNLITLAQLDDNNRYYLPEVQIAENGIFVYNATNELADGTAWLQVSNLNTQPPESRVYKFGYDSLEGRPYIVFPADVGSLIGDGLFIYFVRTSGLSGNISPRTLEILEIPSDSAWEGFSAEQFEVTNDNATTNGANIESISAAYNNFKKTVGTFDTLVTCRDYMNKIYSLMTMDNTPYVSNILVTDIRNDINNAITLCSFNEFGILYKEKPLTGSDGKALIDHFDLVLYPFKTYTQASSGTKDLVTPYNNSFKYTNQMNGEIRAAVSEFKTCAHNFIDPKDSDIVAINNYLRLNAWIATSARVTEAEADSILKNIKVALTNEFNMRNLDFGEEIPFDSILSVIENADSRIKVVSLQEPIVLTTYSVKKTEQETTSSGNISTVVSKEYGIAATASDIISGVDYDYNSSNKTYDCTTAKAIYNKLVLRNILAGRAALFDYDETFVANNSEKPYTVTKDITAEFKKALDVKNAKTDIADENIVERLEAATDWTGKLGILKELDSLEAVFGAPIEVKLAALKRALEKELEEELENELKDDLKRLEQLEKQSTLTDEETTELGALKTNLSDLLDELQSLYDTISEELKDEITAQEPTIDDEALTAAVQAALEEKWPIEVQAVIKAAVAVSLPTEVNDKVIEYINDRLDEISSDFNTAYEDIYDALENKLSGGGVTEGDYILYDTSNVGNVAVRGQHGGIVTLKVANFDNTLAKVGYYYFTSTETPAKTYECKIYETYEHDFTKDLTQDSAPVSPATYGMRSTPSTAPEQATAASGGIIKDIKKVQAVCEITSNTNTFENITLGKNEVIKFRAPNLITTKTFPAYVYYNYTKASPVEDLGDTYETSTSGRYAKAVTLKKFISTTRYSGGLTAFFKGLWAKQFNDIRNESALYWTRDQEVLGDNTLTSIFNTSMVVFYTKATSADNLANGYTIVYSKKPTYPEPLTQEQEEAIEAHARRVNDAVTIIFKSAEDIRDYLKYFATADLYMYYYPLSPGTKSIWNSYIRDRYKAVYGYHLPSVNALYRPSSTNGHPKGRLVLKTGYKLSNITNEDLQNTSVGDTVYICTDLGSNPKFYTVPAKGDVELERGDKLYIHYTPSSTNEDGETVEAEPISIVYEGGDVNNPIILKPSGFTLTPSADVEAQGIASWKKTIEFNGTDVNLLALAPNEQIELRSISKVVLNKPARFFKNFDNEDLEKGTISEYELKDGEYIFYTNQNTQEAAYYGSGSVITLTGGAKIPKTDGLKEVSQILEQGLHIVPWSNIVSLDDKKTVTVTEYQYVTLVEGDNIVSLTINNDSDHGTSVINDSWKPCESAVYTVAGSENTTSLPVINLLPSTGTGWEVCSRLELATAPGVAQELRAIASTPAVDAIPTDIYGTYGDSDNLFSVAINEDTIEFIQTESQNIVKFNYTIDNTGEIKLTDSNSNEINQNEYSVQINADGTIDAVYTYPVTEPDAEVGGEEAWPGQTLTATIARQTNKNDAVTIKDKLIISTITADEDIILEPQETSFGDQDDTVLFEPVSIKLDTVAVSASGTLEVQKVDNLADLKNTVLQMKVFKDEPQKLLDLENIDEVLTPVSSNTSTLAEANGAETINNYWTKLDVGLNLSGSDTSGPRALALSFLVPPDDNDLFGVFSIYLETSNDLDTYGIPTNDSRVFIDIPAELNNDGGQFISIYNCRDANGTAQSWWPGGTNTTYGGNRLYLRAGLNCIKVLKSCSILIKAEPNATSNILYDNMRLVKGRTTKGVNLKLIDFDAAFSTNMAKSKADEEDLADKLLKQIAVLDIDHEFYYNVPIENSLAIEFDNNINSFSDPHTLYDINNINNSFVISKLDVDYLDTGLRIAKSSKY